MKTPFSTSNSVPSKSRLDLRDITASSAFIDALRYFGSPVNRLKIAELQDIGADLCEIALRIAHRAGAQVGVPIGCAGRGFGEADQQSVCKIPRRVEQKPFARRVVAGDQARDHADDGLEHLHVSVDVEVQVLAQPEHAMLQLVIEPHHVERVERFDDRETERMTGDEEVGGFSGDGLDLVVAPRVRLVTEPCVEEFVAHFASRVARDRASTAMRARAPERLRKRRRRPLAHAQTTAASGSSRNGLRRGSPRA